MNNLLDNQKIKRRRYSYGAPGRSHTAREADIRGNEADTRVKRAKKPAFRPAGIISLNEQNSRFIDKIRQEPIRHNQRKRKNPRVKDRVLADISAPEERFEEKGNVSAPKKGFSFSLPAVPAAAMALLALGVFFVVYSQGDYRSGTRIASMDWVNREVVNVLEDYGSHHSLSLYAGLGLQESPDQGEESEIPLDLMETFNWSSYRVRRGDTISHIALNFSISMDAIIASNNISNARALREGEVLRIPNMDGIPYTVRSGDNLIGISRAMGVPLEAILDANDIQSDIINAGMTLFIPGARMNRDDLRTALGEALFIQPVRGARMSSPYGWRNDPFTGERRFHAAIDLAAPQGTPIVAAKDGTVSAMGFDRNLGNFIIISHANGYQTMYAHLHTSSVRRGDQVLQGARIGTVGSTGRSTGPHLHFVIVRNGRAVNPLDFLNSRN